MFEFERIDPRGRTPLHLAISLGEFEIARMLLVSGANPTSKNAGGWSALHEAVSVRIFHFLYRIVQIRTKNLILKILDKRLVTRSWLLKYL